MFLYTTHVYKCTWDQKPVLTNVIIVNYYKIHLKQIPLLYLNHRIRKLN